MDDLGALKTQEACDVPFKFEFKHPVTQKGLGMGVMLVGKDSRAFMAFVEEQADADSARALQFRRRNKTPEEKPFAQKQQDSIDLLIACTTGFWCDPVYEKSDSENSPQTVVREGGNFLYVSGEKLLFSEKNCNVLYRQPEAFRQVNDAIVDLENFIKA